MGIITDDWDDETQAFLDWTSENDIVYPGTESELFKVWKDTKRIAALEAEVAGLRKALEYIKEHRLWINSHCKAVVETALKEAQS
jgi:hypothetical protein